jgi:hypothetical protein
VAQYDLARKQLRQTVQWANGQIRQLEQQSGKQAGYSLMTISEIRDQCEAAIAVLLREDGHAIIHSETE